MLAGGTGGDAAVPYDFEMSVNDTTAVRPAKPRRRWLRVTGWTLLAGVVLVLLGAVGVWWLYASEPAAYERRRDFVLQTDTAELAAMAQDAENRLAAVASGRLPAGVPTFEPVPDGASGREGTTPVRVTFDELNAFLAVRLPVLLAHQGESMPAAVKSLTVWNDGGRPAITVDYDGSELDAVVTATFDVTPLTGDRPGGTLRVAGVRVGLLPLPWSWVVSAVEGAAGGRLDPAAVQALTSLRDGLAFPGVVRLENGRTLRVTRWRVLEDAVELDIRPATPQEAEAAVGLGM